MGKLVYKDCAVLIGGYDISSRLAEIGLEYAFDKVPANSFGQAAHYSLPGLPGVAFDLKGQGDSCDSPLGVEDVLMASLATEKEFSFCPSGALVGQLDYFTKAMSMSYVPGGTVGQMYAFAVQGSGRGEVLVRGMVIGQGEKSSTAAGTAYNLGAASATQKLYGVLHVLALSGTSPTLDVVVESDDAELFSDPVTRLTFTRKTALGAEFASQAGPFTDTWWRLKWTIGGTNTPKFTIVGAIGIQ